MPSGCALILTSSISTTTSDGPGTPTRHELPVIWNMDQPAFAAPHESVYGP
jgi:hypothetical protein